MTLAQIPAETITSMAFDGPVSPTVAVAMVVIFGAAMAFVLWKERQVIGRGWAAVFSVLRILTLAAACWLLLQPSRVERQTVTEISSVAILADSSGSMDTVDDHTWPQMRPWTDDQSDPTSILERAVMDVKYAAGMIRTHWLESAALSGKASTDATAQFDNAITRCRSHLQGVISDPQHSDSQLSDNVQVVLNEVDGLAADHGKMLTVADSEEQSRLADRIVESLDAQALELQSIVSRLRREQMTSGPPAESSSRRTHVARWLNKVESDGLSEIAEEANVKRAVFDAGVHGVTGVNWEKTLTDESVDFAPGAEQKTDLAAAFAFLQPTAAAERLAAVILVSEGQHNAAGGQSPVAAARSLGDVPVITVGIGNPIRRRDLVLHQVNAPRVVSLNDDIKIEAVVSGYDCSGASTEIVLAQGDKEIERHTVDFDTAVGDTRFQFRVPASRLGLRDFQISVQPIDRETSEKNNYAAFSVETVRGTTKVLLADLQPRWEYRYLQLLFRRDRKVDADEYLEMPKRHLGGSIAGLGRLPETVEEWSLYDVVILGDVAINEASREALAEYVTNRSGKLIVIAGRNHMPGAYVNTPLFDILPVQPRQIVLPLEPTVTVTREGLLHPAMQLETSQAASQARWQDVFSKVSMGRVSEWALPRDSARVLAAMSDQDQPSLAFSQERSKLSWLSWHQTGSGRVVYLAAPAAHKLRFRAGDQYHHRFWGQMLRWMMAADLASDEQLVQLRTNKSSYVQGDSVDVTAIVRNAQGFPLSGEVAVELIASDDSKRVIPLHEDENLRGTYRASIADLPPDVFQLKPIGATVDELQRERPELVPSIAVITVEQLGDVEHVMTAANYPLMKEIAVATGGELVTPAGAEELLALLPLDQQVETIENRVPIWNTWPMLCLVIGCLSTEWIARKLKGLV